MSDSQHIRALSLLSGGLDSQLAVCVLKDQGIEVHGIVFESPFFTASAARAAAAQVGIELHVLDFTADILELVNDPPHGFGSGMNPCIDCHARMLRRAGEFMDKEGFHFLSTGEVLNERPMSQNRRSLQVVAHDSGYSEAIVRPLSAGLLPETKPEQLGWVDRARLLSLHGRGRKPQFELARQFGLHDYPTPAGGCCLTEPNFAKRLKDLKDHEGLAELRAIRLLKVGRHFRLAGGLKVVIGRDQADNEFLEKSATPDEWLLKTDGVPGPTCLVSSRAGDEQIRLAGALCARYADCAKDRPVAIEIQSAQGIRQMEVTPMMVEEANRLMI